MLIEILCGGRVKESWVREARALFQQRCRNQCVVQWLDQQDERTLHGYALRPYTRGLDELGRAMTSEQWSAALWEGLERHGCRLALLIGGPDGLGPQVLGALGTSRLWSLGPLTLPHQIAQLVVAEQLYRATTLWRGHPYHRGKAE